MTFFGPVSDSGARVASSETRAGATQFMSVELTCRGGSVSEIKNSDIDR
jgi:hypothetical protein